MKVSMEKINRTLHWYIFHCVFLDYYNTTVWITTTSFEPDVMFTFFNRHWNAEHPTSKVHRIGLDAWSVDVSLQSVWHFFLQHAMLVFHALINPRRESITCIAVCSRAWHFAKTRIVTSSLCSAPRYFRNRSFHSRSFSLRPREVYFCNVKAFACMACWNSRHIFCQTSNVAGLFHH